MLAKRRRKAKVREQALDIQHRDFVRRTPHGIAAGAPMLTGWSITTVGQGARSAP